MKTHSESEVIITKAEILAHFKIPGHVTSFELDNGKLIIKHEMSQESPFQFSD